MDNKNKAIFSLIYQLHKTDNNLNIKEEKYLKDLSKVLNLSELEIKEIISNPESFKLIPPPQEQERMQILYYLLFAMRIDGEIKENEERLIYKLGLTLGFNEVMLRDMITLFKKHLTNRLPNGALLEIIRKYLN